MYLVLIKTNYNILEESQVQERKIEESYKENVEPNNVDKAEQTIGSLCLTTCNSNCRIVSCMEALPW